MPSTNAWPEVGSMRQQSIRMVVVLPAPLGPRKPNTSPSFMVMERSSTATVLSNFRVSSTVSIQVSSTP